MARRFELLTVSARLGELADAIAPTPPRRRRVAIGFAFDFADACAISALSEDVEPNEELGDASQGAEGLMAMAAKMEPTTGKLNPSPVRLRASRSVMQVRSRPYGQPCVRNRS